MCNRYLTPDLCGFTPPLTASRQLQPLAWSTTNVPPRSRAVRARSPKIGSPRTRVRRPLGVDSMVSKTSQLAYSTNNARFEGIRMGRRSSARGPRVSVALFRHGRSTNLAGRPDVTRGGASVAPMLDPGGVRGTMERMDGPRIWRNLSYLHDAHHQSRCASAAVAHAQARPGSLLNRD